jgi:hypothetical protein
MVHLLMRVLGSAGVLAIIVWQRCSCPQLPRNCCDPCEAQCSCTCGCIAQLPGALGVAWSGWCRTGPVLAPRVLGAREPRREASGLVSMCNYVCQVVSDLIIN